jgi:hypothetical protein
MRRRCIEAVRRPGFSAGTAAEKPQIVTLWHPFSLETDMIHGGIASFNESQDPYRVEARAALPAIGVEPSLAERQREPMVMGSRGPAHRP